MPVISQQNRPSFGKRPGRKLIICSICAFSLIIITIYYNHSTDLTIVPDSESVTGFAIYGLEHPQQNVSWQVQVPEDGQWSIFIWYRNASAKNNLTGNKLLIDIDGITRLPVPTVFSSCYQPIIVRETLTSGAHMISIHTDSTENLMLLDYIELMPQ